MSSLSNITNFNLAGAAVLKETMKPGKAGDAKRAGPFALADPAVADGLVHSGGIRSAQASLIAKLKQVNQAINVIFSLEGKNSPLSNMLNQIKSMIKQSNKHLVDAEMNTAKMSMKELVKNMMKGINAPVKEGPKGFNEKEKVPVYIGNGFSIDILEGSIIFDINKMLEEVYSVEQKREDLDRKRQKYREAMGLVKGNLQKLMETLTAEISKVGGLTFILNDIAEASGLSKNVIAKICEESSMMSKSYGRLDAATAMKLLST